jgi:CRP/FNR family cyclic AMP-dependent transcriptional regulator
LRGGSESAFGRLLSAPWGRETLLARIAQKDAREILELSVVREFERGEVLLRENDESLSVYFVLDGFVKITSAASRDRDVLLAVRGRGDVLGELGALDGSPAIATVRAVGRVVAGRIGVDEFRTFLEMRPAVAMQLAQTVAMRLRQAVRRRVVDETLPVPQRIAGLLLELSSSQGMSTPDGVAIAFPLTQPEIAAMVGASEPSVHRLLTALRRDGVINTSYRRVVIRDTEALRELAEGISSRDGFESHRGTVLPAKGI